MNAKGRWCKSSLRYFIKNLKDKFINIILLTLFNTMSQKESLSRYIEKLRVEKAEAIQKYEELKLMFAELYEDTFWLYQWVHANDFFKMKNTPKMDAIKNKWEFNK